MTQILKIDRELEEKFGHQKLLQLVQRATQLWVPHFMVIHPILIITHVNLMMVLEEKSNEPKLLVFILWGS